MKKLLMMGALVLSLVSFSGSALAAGYGDAGCGLGSIVFGNEQGAVQVLASTTNATFGTTTFGITTGTSNCNPAGLVMLEKEREEFAEKNYPTLVKEMAMGKGENLDTLASLYGCYQDSHADFGSMVQENFGNIVKSESTTSQEMLSSLNSEMLGHAVLSKSCSAIIG
ncbi:MAG: DUF3015 family protein [Nitrospinaceae bacterium]